MNFELKEGKIVVSMKSPCSTFIHSSLTQLHNVSTNH